MHSEGSSTDPKVRKGTAPSVFIYGYNYLSHLNFLHDGKAPRGQEVFLVLLTMDAPPASSVPMYGGPPVGAC